MSICQGRGDCGCFCGVWKTPICPRPPFIGCLISLARAALARRGAVAKRTSGHRLRSLIHLLTQPAARTPLFGLSDSYTDARNVYVF